MTLVYQRWGTVACSSTISLQESMSELPVFASSRLCFMITTLNYRALNTSFEEKIENNIELK